MEFSLQLLVLVLGFAMLVKGADFFVDGAASIASKFGIPQLIIGLTVVAMGTSAPEAAVSISAAFAGSAEITIGNIVGSNILNILVILGISSLITTIAVPKEAIWINIPIMTASTVLLLILGYDGKISFFDALIIIACFIAFIMYMIISAKRTNDPGEEIKEMSVLKSLVFAIGGLALIVLGSDFTVDSATYIASVLGVDNRIIGLTVVALGTSLPELFTSVVAARKGNADIAIGNVVGSNIFNILFIVGLSGLIIPVPFAKGFIFDTMVSLSGCILLFLLSVKKGKLGKFGATVMLLGYVAYFITLI